MRGVAIALVVLFHTWSRHLWSVSLPILGPAATFVAAHGYQGVSLFLVLSGFCLSLPLWRRRRDGKQQWFVASEFFARRFLRILPPYYVALVFFTVLKLIGASHHAAALASREPPPNVTNVLTHALLIHNLTGYINSINGSFWSLGLEWQWYWLFPLLFVLSLRSRWWAMIICLALAITWHFTTGDLWGIGALPARLFEFCCGIVAAYLVTNGRTNHWWAFGIGAVAAIALAEWLSIWRVDLGIDQALWGLGFMSLLLCAYGSSHLNRAMSWRPLVLLGLVSYSVYLVDDPIMASVINAAQGSRSLTLVGRSPPLLLAMVLVSSIGAGVIFHFIVERPCMRRSAWLRVGPSLCYLFGWTDRIWGQVESLSGSAAGATLPRGGAVGAAEIDAADSVAPGDRRLSSAQQLGGD
jgi:peptidoglycan/LPS O-acetylase OafA/YrhL